MIILKKILLIIYIILIYIYIYHTWGLLVFSFDSGGRVKPFSINSLNGWNIGKQWDLNTSLILGGSGKICNVFIIWSQIPSPTVYSNNYIYNKYLIE